MKLSARVAVAICLGWLVGCTGRSPAAPTEPAPVVAPPPVLAIFLTPNTWDLHGGGSVALTVVTSASLAGNVPALHATVALETTGGTLSDAQVETDGTGHAIVTWSGTSSATVTARAGNAVASAQISVR